MAGIKTGEKMGMTEIYRLIVANIGFEKSTAAAELRGCVRNSVTKKVCPMSLPIIWLQKETALWPW